MNQIDIDPYRLRTIEDILSIFDGGNFIGRVTSGNQDLLLAMAEHLSEHGPSGCKGTMTLKLTYTMGEQGDLRMVGDVNFEEPKRPKASAGAFVDPDTGELTLYSPMMRKMQPGPRDVPADIETPHDPETGEVHEA